MLIGWRSRTWQVSNTEKHHFICTTCCTCFWVTELHSMCHRSHNTKVNLGCKKIAVRRNLTRSEKIYKKHCWSYGNVTHKLMRCALARFFYAHKILWCGLLLLTLTVMFSYWSAPCDPQRLKAIQMSDKTRVTTWFREKLLMASTGM